MSNSTALVQLVNYARINGIAYYQLFINNRGICYAFANEKMLVPDGEYSAFMVRPLNIVDSYIKVLCPGRANLFIKGCRGILDVGRHIGMVQHTTPFGGLYFHNATKKVSEELKHFKSFKVCITTCLWPKEEQEALFEEQKKVLIKNMGGL